jgi:hypothetical protein
MTRRKKLALSVVAILALGAAGVVAVVALRGPSMQSTCEQIREGMTYDEVVAIIGGQPAVWGTSETPFTTGIWGGRGGAIFVVFDADNRVHAKGFVPAAPSGFFDRLRSWFGL